MIDPELRWWPGRYIFRWCVFLPFFIITRPHLMLGQEFVERQTLKEVRDLTRFQSTASMITFSESGRGPI